MATQPVDENDHPVDFPLAPLFLCDAAGDWIEFEEAAATEHTLFRLHSAKKYEFIAFAADGTKWTKQYQSPAFSIWARIEQYIRMPKIAVPVVWSRCGQYHIDELRDAFVKAVEHDDDALTQFVESDDLIGRLKAAETFPQFVRIWEWLATDNTRTAS